MKISAINSSISNVLAFKSIRTDKKEIEFLKTGQDAILDNKKINIQNALNNLAENGERQSIEFLLDIADNLAYGQGGQSKFATIIDEDTLVSTERENTDWHAMLKDTIEKALKNSKEDTQGLDEEFNRVFASEGGVTKELTPVQQDILSLRKDIIAQLLDDKNTKTVDDIAKVANIRKNIDYFASSSEISFDEKKECFEKFKYILSDDYKINPQLQDKKLQVVDEMLNDMLVKTPESDILTIKEVDQVETGMCAAISICRKLMAYEEKSQYMNLLIGELSADPEMEVFDITELGSGKKTKIKKINVDYDTAIERGYRIVDAAAHNWMHNAHQAGDGTVPLETYTAFDNENYGIYDDTSWYEGIDETQILQKKLLKALIKQKEFIKSLEKQKKKRGKERVSANTTRRILSDEIAQVNGVLNKTFANIFGDTMSISEQTKLIKSAIEFHKGAKQDNEVNISDKMPKEYREERLVEFIKSKTPTRTEVQTEKLVANGKKILEYVEAYNDLNSKMSASNSTKSRTSKYRYNEALFKVAAAHRLAIEADTKMPDAVIRYKNKCKLKPMETHMISHMKEVSKSFNSENVRALYADENGNIPSADELNSVLLADMSFIKNTVPAKTDEVISALYGQNVKELIESIYDDAEAELAKGNKQYLKQFASLFDLKQDKNEVLNAVKNMNAQLKKNPTEETIQRAALAIGHEGRMQVSLVLVNSFLRSMQEGISEEAFANLKERLNIQSDEQLSEALTQIINEFNATMYKYNDIVTKWSIPTLNDMIVKNLENKGDVPTRKDLDIIKNRFDVIHKGYVANKKIENIEERRIADSKLYKFTEREEKILKSFDDRFTDMKRYHKYIYDDLNYLMKADLDDQYSKIGMLNGQFWVGEEGNTGLTSVEELRIIEQMTGKPHYLERNINVAAEEIKKGNGGGIYSSSVEDFDYGFHAQYSPAVSPASFKDPVTGEEIKKDVLWTDNTWGRVEKERFWNGHDGNLYTDYDRDFGWKTGYVLDKSYRIGHPVEQIFGAVGHSKTYDEDFGLFTNVIVKGTPIKSNQELYKTLSRIFSIGEDGPKLYSRLEKFIEDGARVDTKFLAGLDDIASDETDKLRDRLEKEIKTKDDFDKLPADDPLKLLFEKIALHFSTTNLSLQDLVLDVKDYTEIEKYKTTFQEEALKGICDLVCKSEDTLYNMYVSISPDIETVYTEMQQKFGLELTDEKKVEIAKAIYEDNATASKLKGSLQETTNYLVNRVPVVAVEHFETEEQAKFFIEKMQEIIKKDIEDNFKIKSVDSPIIQNSPMGEYFVNAIDKYLQPKNDEEMLSLIQGFQTSEFGVVEDFLDLLTPEDLGLKFRDAWDYVRLYKADNEDVSKAFWDLAATDIITSNIDKNFISCKAENADEDDYSSYHPDSTYRTMLIRLSEMDVQKYIKKFSAEAFQKYRVRQAFPDPVVFTDENLLRAVDTTLETIVRYINNAQSADLIIDAFDTADKFISKYEKNPLFVSLLNKQDFQVQGNEKLLGEFHKDLTDLYNKVSQDSTFGLMAENIEKLQIVLENSETVVDGRKAGVALKKVLEVYTDWQSSMFNKQKFIDSRNNQISEVNESIKIFVEANIEPRYRDNAYRIMNELVAMYKGDVDEETLLEQEEKIKSLMLDKHITKNPTVLLKECVDRLQKGEKDTHEYSILKTYLLNTFKVAMQTKVQYKLVQNQHEGISSKTKDMLSLFNITLSNGEVKSLDNPEGMIYLCQKLKNPSDNNLILNLFLQQSGLSTTAVKSIIDNFEIDKSIDIIDEKADLIKTYLTHLKLAENVFNDFFSKPFIKQDFDSYIKCLVKYIEKQTVGIEDSVVIDGILDDLRQVKLSDNEGVVKSSMVVSLAKNIVDDILSRVSMKINEQMEQLDYIMEYLSEDLDLVYAITLPEGCEEIEMRDKLQEKFNRVAAYKAEKTIEINDFIVSNGMDKTGNSFA